MAVVLSDESPAASVKPVSTFTMRIRSGEWRPGPAPSAGDLVILNVIKPAQVITGPPGWNVSPDGRSFWKVWGPSEQDAATFSAAGAVGWEVKGYAVAAGSYTLP